MARWVVAAAVEADSPVEAAVVGQSAVEADLSAVDRWAAVQSEVGWSVCSLQSVLLDW